MNHCDQVSRRTRTGEPGGSLVCTAFNCIQYTHFVSHGVKWFPRQPHDSSVENCAEGMKWPYGCLRLFSTWYPSCIPAAFNDKSECHLITIVSAYSVRSENILYPNTSSSRKGRSWNYCVHRCRYLRQKQNKKIISIICIGNYNAVFIYTVPYSSTCTEHIWRWSFL